MLGGGRLLNRTRDTVAGLPRGSEHKTTDTLSLNSVNAGGAPSHVHWPQDASSVNPNRRECIQTFAVQERLS